MKAAEFRAGPAPIDVAPTGAAPMRIRIIEDFAEIEARWRDLETNAISPIYQGFDWLELWYRHIGRHDVERLLLVEGWRDDRLAFIWPMGVWRVGPLNVARWLGGKFNNYNLGVWTADALAGIERAEMTDLVAAVAAEARIDTFELLNQPETWEGHANPFALLSHRPSPSNSHVLDLESDFEALYQRRRSSRSRRTLNKKRETLTKAGPIRVIRARDEATVLRIVEALVEQRNARAVAAGIPSVFADYGALELTRDIILAGLRHDGPKMIAHALEVGGVIRATYIGGSHRGRYSCFLNSFRDDELTATSPGEQLLLDVLEDCCKSGMAKVDLGIGEERYKTSWCDPDPLFDSFIPVTALGRLHAQVREWRQTAKRAIKGNPVLWKSIKKLRQLRSRAGI